MRTQWSAFFKAMLMIFSKCVSISSIFDRSFNIWWCLFPTIKPRYLSEASREEFVFVFLHSRFQRKPQLIQYSQLYGTNKIGKETLTNRKILLICGGTQFSSPSLFSSHIVPPVLSISLINQSFQKQSSLVQTGSLAHTHTLCLSLDVIYSSERQWYK